jgi:hypothetical protein
MRRVFLMAIPTLILLGLGLFRSWLKKQNAEISATLQRRDK